MWRTGRPSKGTGDQVDGSVPLGRSGYRVIATFSCGQRFVGLSLQVTIGPRDMGCDACRSRQWFVDRRGHALRDYV
jgi:hypothetical protein